MTIIIIKFIVTLIYSVDMKVENTAHGHKNDYEYICKKYMTLGHLIVRRLHEVSVRQDELSLKKGK